MPIKGWTDVPPRFPRLGTIALGVRDEDGALHAVDHFVVPPEVQAVYGPQPRELDVVLPSEDLYVVMPAWLKRYGGKFGLICRGDGEIATLATNYPGLQEYGVVEKGDALVSAATGEVLEVDRRGDRGWVKIPCGYHDCPFYAQEKCREVAILNVILLRIPGVLGVYSLDTGSINSYRNIRDAIAMLREMVGRAAFVPLKLRVKMETKNPQLKDGRRIRKDVPVLYIDTGDLTLERLIEMARAKRLLASAALPPVEPVEIEPDDEDRKPDLLYGPFPPDEENAEEAEEGATFSDPDRFRRAVFAHLQQWAKDEGLDWKAVDAAMKAVLCKRYDVPSRSNLTPEQWSEVLSGIGIEGLVEEVRKEYAGEFSGEVVVAGVGRVIGHNGGERRGLLLEGGRYALVDPAFGVQQGDRIVVSGVLKWSKKGWMVNAREARKVEGAA